MQQIPNIPIADYDYGLPDDRISQTALEPRDSSRLMIYQSGRISERVFSELPDVLSSGDRLIFNNTKVIPARVFLQNSNGAKIEVFLLHPVGLDHTQALASVESCIWECLIGNSKKWKENEILSLKLDDTTLSLKRTEHQNVRFSWDGPWHFSEILGRIGKIPLPPYIRHDADDEDARRYQTVFSKIEGSVAAPTAGLHFTDRVMNRLGENGITKSFITLHVGAGTFLPVKVEDASQHPMHSESFEVDRTFLRENSTGKRHIAVGTTACRVMESLYYLALAMQRNPDLERLKIDQFPYVGEMQNMSREEVYSTLLSYMENKGLEVLKSQTSIMIVPGYEFKMIDGLVTNFHQPKSTLLLLIAALIGEDWRQVYDRALSSGFRFLSYGDSSLLIP